MTGGLPGALLLGLAFLLGAIPWGYLLARSTRDIDLRQVGSGGTGATNVQRAVGTRASIVVSVLDFLKGFLPVLLAKRLGLDPWWVGGVAVAAVVGHCWSPFIGFKGGKGVATGAGAAVALFPATLVAVPVLAVVVATTRYMSLGSLAASGLTAMLALAAAATDRLNWPAAWAIVAMFAIIAWRHESNMRRLLNGTERRLGETITH